uniref:Uncharacterized protein n=1 Tax=Anopheles melas TaxID=34690 RepID=A0A182U553_9DIPT
MYETGIILKLTDDAWRLPNKALNADSSTVLMFPDLVPVFRFIGYGWLFLKFILLEAYLGQVTSFMIRLRYQENPQTLEQFFASDILLNAPINNFGATSTFINLPS